uniref:Ribosomal protein S12 n=1 Tax=Blastocrithidia nonstop TaxID=2592485 RepID=A0AB38YK97_9TRYP
MRFVVFMYFVCNRVCLCIFKSPRLPSSGNRLFFYVFFKLYNLLLYFFVVCCIFFFIFVLGFEGGGFIDVPGGKLFTRFSL